MMSSQDLKRLAEQVGDRDSLVTLLRDGLGWEVHPEFPFEAEPEIASGVRGKQCVVSSLVSDLERLKVYLVEFQDDYHRDDLRAMLAALRRDERLTRRHGVSGIGDTIFIVVAPRYRDLRFVLFGEGERGLPRIRVFGWGNRSVGRTVVHVNLPALDWGYQSKWPEAWSTLAATNEFFQAYDTFFKRWYPQIQVRPAHNRRLTPEELNEVQVHVMQRTMNRLLFLTFLSKKGWLEFRGPDTRSSYLQELYEDWKSNPDGESFYENRLSKLFFEGLAKDDNRVREVLRPLLGRLPYLNGGLFQRKRWEDEGDGSSDGALLPEGMFEDLLGAGGLLASYNFTAVESYDETDQDIAVDPEMLGRIFEKLVLDRKSEGKYYTPRMVVRFMCRESLKQVLGEAFHSIIDAPNLKEKGKVAARLDGGRLRVVLATLRDIKVVDPACGSGAYLLGMLHELFDLIMAIELRLQERTEAERYQLKLEIIEKNLYGVDMDAFATDIAMLRLWLSLVVDRDENPLDDCSVDVSLPNLRFKICNGDSLAAPNPQEMSLLSSEVYHRHAHRLGELHNEYFLPDRRRTRSKAECLEDIDRELVALDEALEQNPAPDESFDWRRDFAEVFAPAERTGSMRGFDIVLANPPYGLKVNDAVRYAFFDKRAEGSQSKDSYGIFMARALQLLRPGGAMCYIVSDTWRTLKSHIPLRKRLLTKTVHHFIDLPSWIFDATVNTGILTVTNEPPGDGHQVIAADLRSIPNNEWHSLQSNITAIAHHGPDLQTRTFARYTYLQADIATYDNCSFFIASPKLYRLMSDPRFQKVGDIADVKVGLQTGDNEYYLRKRDGVRGSYRILDESKLLTDAEIAGLSEDEKRNGVDPERYGGRHFVPYDKGGESDAEGGWMPNYWVPTGYFIDWSRASIDRLRTASIADVKRRKGEQDRIRPSDETTRAAVIRNPQFYFRQGITFSDSGIYSPSFRQSANSVFDQKGSIIAPNDEANRDVILGAQASTWARFVYKCYVNHSVSSHVDSIKELVLPVDELLRSAVADFVRRIVSNQQVDERYPYHVHEQREIDALIYELYGLDDHDIREVTLWYCRRYRTLAEAQGVLAETREKYADHLAWCDFILSKPPSYWSSHPLLQLISQGEGPRLEFKQSLEYVDSACLDSNIPADRRAGILAEKQKGVLHSALKTICAFLNSTDGGTLLIGVHDKGEIVGIAPDIAMISQNATTDGFENKLRSLIRDRLANVIPGTVQVSFVQLPEGVVCKVVCSTSRYSVFLDNKLYVRDGNGTVELVGPRLEAWLQGRTARASAEEPL